MSDDRRSPISESDDDDVISILQTNIETVWDERRTDVLKSFLVESIFDPVPDPAAVRKVSKSIGLDEDAVQKRIVVLRRGYIQEPAKFFALCQKRSKNPALFTLSQVEKATKTWKVPQKFAIPTSTSKVEDASIKREMESPIRLTPSSISLPPPLVPSASTEVPSTTSLSLSQSGITSDSRPHSTPTTSSSLSNPNPQPQVVTGTSTETGSEVPPSTTTPSLVVSSEEEEREDVADVLDRDDDMEISDQTENVGVKAADQEEEENVEMKDDPTTADEQADTGISLRTTSSNASTATVNNGETVTAETSKLGNDNVTDDSEESEDAGFVNGALRGWLFDHMNFPYPDEASLRGLSNALNVSQNVIARRLSEMRRHYAANISDFRLHMSIFLPRSAVFSNSASVIECLSQWAEYTSKEKGPTVRTAEAKYNSAVLRWYANHIGNPYPRGEDMITVALEARMTRENVYKQVDALVNLSPKATCAVVRDHVNIPLEAMVSQKGLGKWALPARQWISEHLSNPFVSLEDLTEDASSFGLSASQLYREVKKDRQAPPHTIAEWATYNLSRYVSVEEVQRLMTNWEPIDEEEEEDDESVDEEVKGEEEDGDADQTVDTEDNSYLMKWKSPSDQVYAWFVRHCDQSFTPPPSIPDEIRELGVSRKCFRDRIYAMKKKRSAEGVIAVFAKFGRILSPEQLEHYRTNVWNPPSAAVDQISDVSDAAESDSRSQPMPAKRVLAPVTVSQWVLVDRWFSEHIRSPFVENVSSRLLSDWGLTREQVSKRLLELRNLSPDTLQQLVIKFAKRAYTVAELTEFMHDWKVGPQTLGSDDGESNSESGESEGEEEREKDKDEEGSEEEREEGNIAPGRRVTSLAAPDVPMELKLQVVQWAFENFTHPYLERNDAIPGIDTEALSVQEQREYLRLLRKAFSRSSYPSRHVTVLKQFASRLGYVLPQTKEEFQQLSAHWGKSRPESVTGLERCEPDENTGLERCEPDENIRTVKLVRTNRRHDPSFLATARWILEHLDNPFLPENETIPDSELNRYKQRRMLYRMRVSIKKRPGYVDYLRSLVEREENSADGSDNESDSESETEEEPKSRPVAAKYAPSFLAAVAWALSHLDRPVLAAGETIPGSDAPVEKQRETLRHIRSKLRSDPTREEYYRNLLKSRGYIVPDVAAEDKSGSSEEEQTQPGDENEEEEEENSMHSFGSRFSPSLLTTIRWLLEHLDHPYLEKDETIPGSDRTRKQQVDMLKRLRAKIKNPAILERYRQLASQSVSRESTGRKEESSHSSHPSGASKKNVNVVKEETPSSASEDDERGTDTDDEDSHKERKSRYDFSQPQAQVDRWFLTNIEHAHLKPEWDTLPGVDPQLISRKLQEKRLTHLRGYYRHKLSTILRIAAHLGVPLDTTEQERSRIDALWRTNTPMGRPGGPKKVLGKRSREKDADDDNDNSNEEMSKNSNSLAPGQPLPAGGFYRSARKNVLLSPQSFSPASESDTITLRRSQPSVPVKQSPEIVLPPKSALKSSSTPSGRRSDEGIIRLKKKGDSNSTFADESNLTNAPSKRVKFAGESSEPTSFSQFIASQSLVATPRPTTPTSTAPLPLTVTSSSTTTTKTSSLDSYSTSSSAKRPKTIGSAPTSFSAVPSQSTTTSVTATTTAAVTSSVSTSHETREEVLSQLEPQQSRLKELWHDFMTASDSSPSSSVPDRIREFINFSAVIIAHENLRYAAVEYFMSLSDRKLLTLDGARMFTFELDDLLVTAENL